MTEQEFLDLITSKSAKAVLDELSIIPAKERRAFAKPAMTRFKKLDRFWTIADRPSELQVKDGEAVTIAVLATASGSELKKMSFFPIPQKVSLEGIVRKLQPDWLQAVVDHFVEERVFYVAQFRSLWTAGLCERPESDAIILSYYGYMATLNDVDEDSLLTGDVWRFFEVEGGGEDSLANHDKFLKRGQASWADQLKRYSVEGKLDRQRLLDASLEALERDFAQYRAGWYSRFHVLMAPDANEMAAWADRYLRLLASSIPPTVSFALKYVQALDKAGVLDGSNLLAALGSALQARAKGTVGAALKLLLSAAKRQTNLRAEAASKAVLALISEDAGVQGKALDAIEVLGPETVVTELAEYVDLVAPSVRPRIVALTGVAADPVPAADIVSSPATAQPIVPVASAQDTLTSLLSLLEDPRDPFEVERAIDGVSRFGPALLANKTVLSPLRKRAKQVCKSPGESDIRFVLAMTGLALAEGQSLRAILSEQSDSQYDYAFVQKLSLQEFHLARNVAIVERVIKGVSLPLLALPSDTSGTVSVTDLCSRMATYRNAGVEPDLKDLELSLMRLAPKSGSAESLTTVTEADRAVAYALGVQVQVGPTPELWAAAWRARQSEKPDGEVAKLFKKPMPDCGVPAATELMVTAKHSEGGEYTWIDVKAPVTPLNDIGCCALPALFGTEARRHFDQTCCGNTYADIAWASLSRPADYEPFFRIGLITQDTWQKLSDNPTRAYLEPLFRPGPPIELLGAGILAYYMACEDKSVSSLAIEATTTLAAEGRLSTEVFVAALKQFMMSHSLPTSRWTKAMKTVADLGAGRFARDVIVGLLDFAPDDTPRDIGGLLELCYELHFAQNAALKNTKAVACLETIPGGGKAARFRKKLLVLASHG
ncbi:DUF6493 family protein [Rhodobacteraceae bacterium]|nr:DUF6493 family protein [Paracoccaceae bacterium]